MLWGRKKEAAQVGAAPAAGANRWDTAQFSSSQEQQRFQKLMGVKGQQLGAGGAGAGGAEDEEELQGAHRVMSSK
jgi:hypothetical protein